MANEDIRSVLGKQVSPPRGYDKSILVRELRQNNRQHLAIEGDNLPFVGVDVWNGYEVSALCENGLPTAFIAKVTYNCDSKYLVESKSMKLYWNSFNMEKLGKRASDVARNLIETTSRDLSELIEADVRVELRAGQFAEDTPRWPFQHVPASLLEAQGWADELDFEAYEESPGLLKEDAATFEQCRSLHASSSLLKSNCKITSQADWGDVFIDLRGRNLPSPKALLKYIVSFRNECHFHEEIIECLYQRLATEFQPDDLSVTGLFLRRGGWDICPHRVSRSELLKIELAGEGYPYRRTPRQ